ncbi:hypothetical protein QAD02_009363, partial [Eretmocerus hayati]
PTTEYPDSATEVYANDDAWNSQNLRRESRAARGPTAKQLRAYISAQNSKVYNPRGYELAWRIQCPGVEPLELKGIPGVPFLKDFSEGMSLKLASRRAIIRVANRFLRKTGLMIVEKGKCKNFQGSTQTGGNQPPPLSKDGSDLSENEIKAAWEAIGNASKQLQAKSR